MAKKNPPRVVSNPPPPPPQSAPPQKKRTDREEVRGGSLALSMSIHVVPVCVMKEATGNNMATLAKLQVNRIGA